MEIQFRQVRPWGILPRKVTVDVRPKQEEVRMIADNFRWIRASRSAELCYPWRLGQELGWVVDSPVGVTTMDALNDVEVLCTPQEQQYVQMITGGTEIWNFGDDAGNIERVHFTRRAGWMALYDFKVDGRVERMFYLNGQGSVEWVMGWDPVLPPGYSLLILPYGPIPNLEVLVGVLDAKALAKRAGRTNGISIAIRPTGPVTLRRGQPFARVVLLHQDSLTAKATVADAPPAAAPAAPPPSGA